MASLLADENFPRSAVLALRRLGHNVLTATEAGLADKRVPDEIVLSARIDQSIRVAGDLPGKILQIPR